MGRSLLLLSVICAIFTVCFAIAGNDNDSQNCLASAGYMWCARTKSCIRPWELATEQNIQNTKQSVELFCAYSTEKGNDADAHGCIKSAGYSWCQKENACVRPWELAKAKNLYFNDESFDLYCSSSTDLVGDDADDNNCLQSAGYLWCARENKCIRPWVLAKQKNLSYSASTVALYCSSTPSSSDDDFCLTSAGYSWCQKVGRCVRPFELSKQMNIKFTPESFAAYCSPSLEGADKDANGCIASAGYSWCQKENACVRPWELGTQKNIKFTAETFAAYCSGPIAGSDKDATGCIASAGYSWCQKENACVRPWELGTQKNIKFTAETFAAYCAGPIAGSDKDANGCIVSAGYTWCQKLNQCVHPWELAKTQNIETSPEAVAAFCAASSQEGGDKDANGCLVAAGYSWCQRLNQCVQPWELAKEQNIDASPEVVAAFCNSDPSPKGADADSNGCIASAGYSWCQKEGACVRPWELGKQQNIKFTAETFAAYCSGSNVEGGETDANGCLTAAGYSFCQRLNQCVRPWELAKTQNIEASPEAVAAFCNSDASDDSCLASAGYSWCQRLNQCVRPWELAKAQNIEASPEAVAAFCNTPTSQEGGATDANGCLTMAGYSWCQKENACVRPWELGKEKNVKFTPATFAAYCSGSNVEGGETDANGCLTAAGYSFCQRLNKCVRPWELAKEQNIGFSSEEFNAYCNQEGGDKDANGCLVAAGYMWCARENECVRPWQLASLKNIEFTREAVSAYCSSTPSLDGADRDDHGCIASAGYSWCQKESACVRPWELGKQQNIKFTAETFAAYCSGSNVEGGETDTHGCLTAAGYSWCQREGACVRPWELATKVGQQDITTEKGFVAYCESMIV